MIPTFPDFKPISLADRAEIEVHARRHPPLSDFNFASLFCYGAGAFSAGWLHGNLAVRMRDYVTAEPFYAFLGDREPAATARALLERSAAEGIEPRLRLVAETAAMALRGAGFAVSEDEGAADYVLDTEAVALLPADTFYHKRRGVRRFRRVFPGHAVRELDPSDARARVAVLGLLGAWRDGKRRTDEDVAAEFEAIGRWLRHAPALGVRALGIWIGDRLVAFAAYEAVHGGYAMGHFLKADPAYRHAACCMLSETARAALAAGYRWLNFQQDLGLPGLRASKRSWKPLGFLRKYDVRKSG